MAEKIPYIPEFPYKKPQLLFTSNRVVLHAKKDSVFLFGKKAIGLSTPGRFNVDAGEGTTFNSPEIELGLEAKKKGEPVAKATTLVTVLNDLTTVLQRLATALASQNKVVIAQESGLVAEYCLNVKRVLEDIKSTITYTR